VVYLILQPDILEMEQLTYLELLQCFKRVETKKFQSTLSQNTLTGLPTKGFKERFKVHMLHQRILDWGCAKAINPVTWDKNLSFSQWAETYTEAAFL